LPDFDPIKEILKLVNISTGPKPLPPKPLSAAELLSKFVIGPKTLAAQQALSNQFAIPTFNVTGGISTVPTTGLIGPINVGTGAIAKETFDNAVREFNANVLRFGPSSPSQPPLQPNPPGTTTPGTSQSIFDSLKQGFASIPPVALLGVAGLAVLLLLKK